MDKIATIQYGSSEITSCKECSRAIKKELVNIATGFVKIGYLLRMARDTGLIHTEGYRNMEEFAQNEFKMDKSAVSRFIRINEKYSEGGYSDHIRSEYSKYSYSSLAEMLTIPDEVAAVIAPENTREQIREIKKEYAEEQERTDIEVMMEAPQQAAVALDTLGKRFFYYYLKETPELFCRLLKIIDRIGSQKDIYEALAPAGVCTAFARAPQTGKLMLNMTGINNPVRILNMRSGEKEELKIDEIEGLIISILPDREGTAEELWEYTYGEDFPGKESTVQKENKKEVQKPAQNSITTYAGGNSDGLEKKPEKLINTLLESTSSKTNTKKQENTSNKPETKIEEKPVNNIEERGTDEACEIKKSMEILSSIERYIIQRRWQQALYEIRDLNDELIRLKDKAKIIDIPGQMSMDITAEDTENVKSEG